MDEYQKYIYYVYKHIDPRDNNLLYIGMGSKGRAWTHGSDKTIIRDQAHLAKLDEMIEFGFVSSDWVHIVAQGLDKSSACQLEQELIRKEEPMYNKPYGKKLLVVVGDLWKKALDLREKGLSYKEIGKEINISTMSVYRALNYQNKNRAY